MGTLDQAWLDTVIIVCIVIGLLAFVFIVFILFWAWRYDKKNRDAFKANRDNAERQKSDKDVARMMENGGEISENGNKHEQPELDMMDDSVDTNSQSPYPRMIGTGDEGNYPESVISEDMNTTIEQTLQQHSSLSLQGSQSTGQMINNRAVGGGGSVSSMDVESYGYSLEGYSASLVTAMHHDGASLAPSQGGNSLGGGSQGGDSQGPQPVENRINIRSSGTLETESGDEGDLRKLPSEEY